MSDASEPRQRTSRLELTFSCRAGQTYLADTFAEVSLEVVRPFGLGGGRVLVHLLNVGPGLLAGGRYELNVRLEPGTQVVLVNQSATKLHTMPPGESARQRLHTVVGAGAALEYFPGLTLPFRDTDAGFKTTVQLSHNARFAVLESWAMGRAGRDETFLFRRLSNQLEVFRDAQLLYADRLELTPAATKRPDGATYLALGFWQWDVPWPTLERPQIEWVSGVCGPNRGYLRALAGDGLELTQAAKAQPQAWQLARGVTPVPFERLLL